MRKLKAFTLIELLVVIAIIAILASILFPVFAQAKQAAKKIVAISNLKQIGTATMLYLGDTDGSFPQSMYMADGDGFINGTGTQVYAVWDALMPYTKNRDIYQAPGDPKAIPWSDKPQTLNTVIGSYSGGAWTSYSNIKNVSFSWNAALFEDPAVPPTLLGNDPVISEGALNDPVYTSMFYDARWIKDGQNNIDAPTTSPYYAPINLTQFNFPGTARYNESLCVCFADSHAKAFRKKARIDSQAPDPVTPGNMIDVYNLPYDLNGLPELIAEPSF